MKAFCPDVMADVEYKSKLESLFENQVGLYRDLYNEYSQSLKIMLKNNFDGTSNTKSLYDSKKIIEFPSSSAETLARIILSLYSKGPTIDITWQDLKTNFNTILDLLQATLKDNNVGQHFALAVILETRYDRNISNHYNGLADNPSVIRLMNVIREMLVFIDPELEGNLPKFEFPNEKLPDIQSLFSNDILDYKHRKLVLVVGSLHDIPENQRALLANMPWSVVIDLDAASDYGGLRSAVNDEKRINTVLWNTVDPNADRSVDSGITDWYTCGDYLDLLNHNQRISNSTYSRLSSYQHLSSSVKNEDIEQDIDQLYDDTLSSFRNSPKPVTIIYMHNDFDFANGFTSNIPRKLRRIGYTFIGVYYHKKEDVKKLASNMRANYPEEDLDRFNYFCCDLQSFFSELEKYKSRLPIIKPSEIEQTLPGNYGPVRLETNRMQTLSEYFDVLYSGCDVFDPEKAGKAKEEFFKGKQVEWSVLASPDGIVPFFRHQSEKIKKKIIGRLKIANSDNVVTVYHTPGLGGSTFVRMLCHSMHKEWPVVCTRADYSADMAEQLKKLYDKLKKGIVILADSMDNSSIIALSDNLKKYQTRPFCIVTSQRSTDIHPDMLTALSDEETTQFVNRYYEVSTLSNKTQKYNDFINTFTSQMKVPFLIALYFFDKDFYGVADYVKKTLSQCETKGEQKVIAYSALLNLFCQSKSLPNKFALYLTYGFINPLKRFLNEKKYANSILMENDKNSGITTKHYLISKEILRQTAISLGYMSQNDDYSLFIFRFACDFANDYFDYIKHSSHGFEEEDNDILKALIIEKEEGRFSNLIETIGLNDYSEQVYKAFIKQAEQYTSDVRNADSQKRLFNALAHFWGHFGRFYGCNDNIKYQDRKEAVSCAEKALEYMEKASAKDSLIYHMCGESYRKYLFEKLKNLSSAGFTKEKYCEEAIKLDEIFTITVKMYDLSAEYGNMMYAYLSQLELYVDFIGKMYYEDGKDKVWCLSPDKKALYFEDVNNLIDVIDNFEMPEIQNINFIKTVQKFNAINNCDSIGEIINYYDGQVHSCRAKQDPAYKLVSMFGQLHAYLKKWKESPDNRDLERIMNLLDDIVEQPLSVSDPHAKRRMAFAFRKWLYFARLSSRSINIGLKIAERWANLCNDMKIKDPRPYYNLYVLNYLNMLEGADKAQDAEDNKLLCTKFAQDSIALYGKLSTYQDCLIRGEGMGQLCPLSMMQAIDKTKLVSIKGVFEGTESKMGFIRITEPQRWKDRKAKIRLTSSLVTLSDKVRTHVVEFYCAFTYEQIMAYRDLAADITSKENLNNIYDSAVSLHDSSVKSTH